MSGLAKEDVEAPDDVRVMVWKLSQLTIYKDEVSVCVTDKFLHVFVIFINPLLLHQFTPRIQRGEEFWNKKFISFNPHIREKKRFTYNFSFN